MAVATATDGKRPDGTVNVTVTCAVDRGDADPRRARPETLVRHRDRADRYPARDCHRGRRGGS
jgi:hypothetical protein